MRTFGIQLFAIIAIFFVSNSTSYAQLTWDPDGNQISDGGDGTWDFSTNNWDDNGSAPNVNWPNGSDAIFGGKADGSVSEINLAAFLGVTVGDITLTPGGGAIRLIAGFDGDGPVVAAGGGTWELGGRVLQLANNDISFSSDTALFMTSGDTLTITDSVGGGVFNTGERPTGASWLVPNATLDVQDAVTVRGNPDSVGQFTTVKMGDGTEYIHERNAGQTYANNWELSGAVTFDNRFVRAANLDGLITDGASPGQVVIADLGGSLYRLRNESNSFTGGVVIDSTNSRSELDFVFGAADTSGFGALPGSFDADNITLRNGGELKLRGQTIDSNRGITLDGGGTIVLNTAPATYGGTITGTGGLQIGRTQGADGNTLVLTSNTHTYTGDTTIFQGSLEMGADNVIPTDQVLTIGGKGGSRLRMSGFDQEIAGLRTAANNTREIVNDGASVSTLTINTAADTSHTYNGNVNGTNAVSIVKNGEGTQLFNRGGNFTVAPELTVNGGRLRIANPILDDDPDSTSSPTALLQPVTVNSGGTFVVDAGQAVLNDGIGWDEEEIAFLLSNATFNTGSLLGINNGAGDFTYAGNISGNQGLNKIQTNTLTLNGVNTYAGPTIVENGTVLADSPDALPDTGLTVQGTEGPGYIGFNLDNWSEAQVDARINAGTTTFEANAGVELAISANETYSQVIPSSVTNFAMRATPDSAELTLTAANAYSGDTTVRSGRLIKGAAAAVPSGTQLTLGEGAAAARFEMNGFDQATGGLQTNTTGAVEFANSTEFVAPTTTATIDVAEGEAYVFNGRMGGTVGINDNNFNVVKNGAGSQTFGGPNSYQGTTAINAGRLVIEQPLDPAALNPGDVTIAAGAEVILEGGGVSEWSDSQIQSFLADQSFAAGTTTFGIQTGDTGENFTFNGVVSGNKNFVKLGSQALTLTAAQTYTGDTHLANGTVELNSGVDNTLPAGTVLTIGSANAGTTVFLNGNNQEVGGLIAGGSGSGNRRIANGSAAAATLTVNVAGSESYTYNHTLGIEGDADANNLSLTKTGTGSQAIFTSFHTGPTNINAGTLLFNGGASNATGDVTVSAGATMGGGGSVGGAVTALSGSTVAPGATVGTLNVLSSFTLDAGASLDFDIDPTDQTVGAGTNDLIDMSAATGALTLNGSLNVTALGSSAADFNGDGTVDGLDLTQWESDYGLNGDSDADGDGDSDGFDMLIWQRDRGLSGDFSSAQAGDSWTLFTYDEANVTLNNSLTLGSVPALGAGLEFVIDDSITGQIDLVVSSIALAAAQVPEPSSILLLSIGGLGLLRRRRAVRK